MRAAVTRTRLQCRIEDALLQLRRQHLGRALAPANAGNGGQSILGKRGPQRQHRRTGDFQLVCNAGIGNSLMRQQRILQRSATFCGELPFRTSSSSSRFWSAVMASGAATLNMLQLRDPLIVKNY